MAQMFRHGRAIFARGGALPQKEKMTTPTVFRADVSAFSRDDVAICHVQIARRKGRRIEKKGFEFCKVCTEMRKSALTTAKMLF